MSKTLKRSICFLLAIAMVVTSLLIPDTKALAATSEQKKVHIRVGEYDSSAIKVKFAKGDYKITNLKSSGKNLHARVTGTDSASREDEWDSEYPWGYAQIGLYAKKKGNYTVTFDVINHDKKVTSSHSVKVYVTNEYPIKNVTYANGYYFYGIAKKGSGKFKVNMTKGYKLKSITMTTYNKSGKPVTKKIKNGAKVTLGKYRYKSEYSKSSTYESWWADLLARTEFTITYADKYTKEAKEITYVFYRIPKN